MSGVDQPSAFESVAVDLRDYVVSDASEPVIQRVFATDVVAIDLICLEPKQAAGLG